MCRWCEHGGVKAMGIHCVLVVYLCVFVMVVTVHVSIYVVLFDN